MSNILSCKSLSLVNQSKCSLDNFSAYALLSSLSLLSCHTNPSLHSPRVFCPLLGLIHEVTKHPSLSSFSSLRGLPGAQLLITPHSMWAIPCHMLGEQRNHISSNYTNRITTMPKMMLFLSKFSHFWNSISLRSSQPGVRLDIILLRSHFSSSRGPLQYDIAAPFN